MARGGRLVRRVQGVRILEQGDPDPPPDDPRRLEAEVSGLRSRHDGFAVVGGHWRVRDGDGRLLATRQRSVGRPPAADGCQAPVESLTAAWRSVTAEPTPAMEQSRLP